jgi:hypothetical protein
MKCLLCVGERVVHLPRDKKRMWLDVKEELACTKTVNSGSTIRVYSLY